MATQARCKQCRIRYLLNGFAQKPTLQSKILKCPVCNSVLIATTHYCKDKVENVCLVMEWR